MQHEGSVSLLYGLVPPGRSRKLSDGQARVPFLIATKFPNQVSMSIPRMIVFDVETTGTDKQLDQVIELCVQFGLGEDAPARTWRVRPGVPMHPGAQAVHGISLAELSGCPEFSSIADEVRDLFAEARILVGYNLRFDIDMLQAEYMRLRQPLLDLTDKLVLDPFRLWQECEPRSLTHAHRRFVGGDFDLAHSAQADVAATGRVLKGMIDGFGLSSNWEQIANICQPSRVRWLGGSSHVQRSKDGPLVLGFGKHTGTAILEMVAGPNVEYLQWILEKDFPVHVHEIIGHALSKSPEMFNQWINTKYPPKDVAEKRGGSAQAQTSSKSRETRSPGVDSRASELRRKKRARPVSPAQQSLFPL